MQPPTAKDHLRCLRGVQRRCRQRFASCNWSAGLKEGMHISRRLKSLKSFYLVCRMRGLQQGTCEVALGPYSGYTARNYPTMFGRVKVRPQISSAMPMIRGWRPIYLVRYHKHYLLRSSRLTWRFSPSGQGQSHEKSS